MLDAVRGEELSIIILYLHDAHNHHYHRTLFALRKASHHTSRHSCDHVIHLHVLCRLSRITAPVMFEFYPTDARSHEYLRPRTALAQLFKATILVVLQGGAY